MTDVILSKKCHTCNTVKIKNSFNRNKSNSDGLSTQCKKCCAKAQKKLYRTESRNIYVMYRGHKIRNIERNHGEIPYSLKQLEEWLYKNGFYAMWCQWCWSGYDVNIKPSVDRIDDSKGYSFDNIQLITWKENNRKSFRDRFSGKLKSKQNKPVNQYSKNGDFINRFETQRIASRETGICNTHISKNCLGKRKTAGGFIWRFALGE